MNAERTIYLDSSAIVKLALAEPESAALRSYLDRGRRPRRVITSSLARTEVVRAVRLTGADPGRGEQALARVELVRVSDAILKVASELRPDELRSLDAIHLATAEILGDDVTRLCTYDQRMADAATALGMTVVAPH